MSALDDVCNHELIAAPTMNQQRQAAAELAALRATVDAQAAAIEEARYCITRRLRFHECYPPTGSARWIDREAGISGEDSRNCDCDYCIEDRAWLAAHAAPSKHEATL